jgi:hypothetical protein
MRASGIISLAQAPAVEILGCGEDIKITHHLGELKKGIIERDLSKAK